MDILLHPTYFPSISHFVAMVQTQSVTFETDDNFQKQTNRNRMYIYSANGLQLLNIPIKHSKELIHQKYRDIKIENELNWRARYSKSLEAAYRPSRYSEVIEDEIRPICESKQTFVLDLNWTIHEIVTGCLCIDIPSLQTQEFFKEGPQTDLR